MYRNQSSTTSGVTALRDSKQSEAAAILKFVELISLDVDLQRTKQLELRNKEIRALPLRLNTVLCEVRKLDLSFNHITDVSPLSMLPHLSNLNLSKNPELRSLSGLKCNNLVVLSVAHCSLQFLTGLESSSATLRTLIANDNELQLQSPFILEEDESTTPHSSNDKDVPEVAAAVENYKILASLKALETVVLSRNAQLCSLYPHDSEKIKDQSKSSCKADPTLQECNKGGRDEDAIQKATEEGSCSNNACPNTHPLAVFEELTQLKKLSLSECNIFTLPSRWFLPLVTELRLSHNSLTSLRPEGVILRSIKILDISYNRLESIVTLRRCLFLRQINLKGNPLISIYVQRDQEECGGIGEKAPTAMSEDQSREECEKVKSVPRSLQRSLQRMLKHIQQIDGQPLLPIEKLTVKRLKSVKEVPMSEEGEAVAKKTDIQNLINETPVPSKKRQRGEGSQKQDKSSAEKISKELDEKDVVLNVPEMKEAHAPIVRREKVYQVRKAGLIESSGATVATLLKQSNEPASW